MLQIGLTGNIGSGKTTVCKIFEILGVPVFYADLRARAIMGNQAVKEQIISIFGLKVAEKRGEINRKALAEVVFNDKTMLEKLNGIIHPLVREDYNQWILVQANPKYVIQEAAILFEAGLASRFHKVIVVAAPPDVRIDRVMKRDGVSRPEVLKRASNQFEQEVLISLADFVVHNNSKQLVIPQVLAIDSKLRNLQQ